MAVSDRLSELTTADPAANTIATTIVTIVINDLVVSLGIPPRVLTDKSPHSTTKLFEMIREDLQSPKLTTTEYQLQTDGQVEWSNATIASRLRHYVAEHQQGWSSYVEPLL